MEPDLIASILRSLPPKPPRSRLEPYAAIIDELRALGWTYRDVARLLHEKAGLVVSPSNVHRFVQARGRKPSTRPPTRAPESHAGRRLHGEERSGSPADDRVKEQERQDFSFDETEPFRLAKR